MTSVRYRGCEICLYGPALRSLSALYCLHYVHYDSFLRKGALEIILPVIVFLHCFHAYWQSSYSFRVHHPSYALPPLCPFALSSSLFLFEFFRDCHVLHFSCDGLTARFDFTPIHPFSLHIRSGMSFPSDFHNTHSLRLLVDLPLQFDALFEGFKRSIHLVQHTAEEVSTGIIYVNFLNLIFFLDSVHVFFSLS